MVNEIEVRRGSGVRRGFRYSIWSIEERVEGSEI